MPEGHGSAARIRQTTEGVGESLRPAVDIIPHLAWTALPDGSVDYCNRRRLEYTGLTEDRAAGWGWTDAVHPDSDNRHSLRRPGSWNREISGGGGAQAPPRAHGRG